jgi:hypothetical protein
MRFEWNFWKKIHGTTELTDVTWRIEINEQLDNLIEHKSIIYFIESQRLRWLGHVERMSEERDVKKIQGEAEQIKQI